MTGAEQRPEETVDIFIAYNAPEHVTTISNGMARKVPPRILAHTVDELPQLLLAGSIAVRILVQGLIEWSQKVKGILICERDPEDDGEDKTITVRPVEPQSVDGVMIVGGGVIVTDRKGNKEFYDLTTTRSSVLEAALTALVKD